MRSKLILAGLALASLFAVPVVANAADFGPRPAYKAPAYTAPAVFSWSGFYVGINGGYAFGTSDWTGGVPVSLDPKGWMFGPTIGYNIQTGSWVWGIEGDWDWSSQKQSKGCGAGTCTFDDQWFATARGRIGYAGWSNVLPYFTAGAAFASEKATNSAAGGGTTTDTRVGWTAGVGLEYALWTSWSLKFEYLYADLGKFDCPTCVPGAGSDQVSFKNNIVRAGINYRF
jgi:outer membrane immunogenic protein